MNDTLQIELERLIDRHGPESVVTAIEETCWAKAQHIEENWDDTKTSADWRQAAKKVAALANWIHRRLTW